MLHQRQGRIRHATHSQVQAFVAHSIAMVATRFSFVCSALFPCFLDPPFVMSCGRLYTVHCWIYSICVSPSVVPILPPPRCSLVSPPIIRVNVASCIRCCLVRVIGVVAAPPSCIPSSHDWTSINSSHNKRPRWDWPNKHRSYPMRWERSLHRPSFRRV